MQVWDAVV